MPSTDTRARILDATVAQIEAHGEASVRLRDVAAAVGLSEPTLYHYFQGREQLVVAAHAHRYRTNLGVTMDPFIAALRTCSSREQLAEIMRGLYERSFMPDRTGARATRSEILGSSFHRPALRQEVVSAMRNSMVPAIEILRAGQAAGWFRSDISPEVFAFWNLAHVTGLIFAEIQADEQLLDEWRRLAFEVVTSTVTGPPAPPDPPADTRKRQKSRT